MKRLIILVLIAGLSGAAAAAFVSWREASAPGQEAEVQQLDGESAFIQQSVDYFVSYTEEGYSPEILIVKAGDTVAFENRSSISHSPASDPHPLHSDYPEFDAIEPVAPGDIYTFTFTRVGEWGYHDHLNPSLTGVIVVEE